jgi:hypothetical protein
VITLDELKANARMRSVLCLDMAHGAYMNQYRSATYPRLVVVKAGSPHSPKIKQHHTTQYFVDDIECDDLAAVVDMLNAEPHPQRAGVFQATQENKGDADV